MLAVYRKSFAQLAGAVSELTPRGVNPSPACHQLEARYGFYGSDEDGMGLADLPCDDIEVVVHAVDEENIGVSRRPEHDLRARRAPAIPAVRCSVFGTSVRFCFDDAADRHAIGRSVDQRLTDALARDLEHGACVERAGQGAEAKTGLSPGFCLGARRLIAVMRPRLPDTPTIW